MPKQFPYKRFPHKLSLIYFVLAFSFFLCIDVFSHKMIFNKIFECTTLRTKMKNALYRGLAYSLLAAFLCRTYPR